MLQSPEPDLLTFDPAEVRRCFEQSELIDAYGPSAMPDMEWQWTATGPFAPRGVVLAFDGDCAGLEAATRAATLLASRPRFRGNDADFAAYLKALRMAVSFPLNGLMCSRMRLLLDVAEEERAFRVARKKMAASFRPNEWTPEMFRSEVEALCGQGRPVGADVWYHCPLGVHDDSTASMHVNFDKRIWHCFGCQAGGGHSEWRRRVRGHEPTQSDFGRR